MSVITGLFFWLLLYFENVSFGGLTLGQIWKLPLEIFLILLVIVIRFNRIKFKLSLPIFFFIAIGGILTIRFAVKGDFFNAIQFYMNSLIWMLIYVFSINSLSISRARRLILYFATLFIVSNIPFLLGVPMRTDNIALDRFGLTGLSGLSGLFYNVSVNSKILVSSILSVFFLMNKNKLKTPLLIFGILFLMMTFTRTGVISLVIAFLFYIYSSPNYQKSTVIKITLSLSIIGVLLLQNDTVRLRLRGGTTYRQNEELNLDVLTSYRLTINAASYDQFRKDNLVNIVLGQGPARTRHRLAEFYGINFIPHSRFVQLLCYWGVLGIASYSLLLFHLFSVLLRLPANSLKYASFAFLFLDILWSTLSHGSPIWSQVLFGIILFMALRTSNENISYSL